jgi:hypothetical protein
LNKQETGKILTLICEMYPSFKKDRNIQVAQTVWQRIFRQTPYDLVRDALLSYIATDTKGYPPVPGAINERIGQMRELAGMNENEAWGLVYKALCRGIYNSREEFDKLPEDIRQIIGHPRQLHEWAMLDTHEVSTVIMSSFKRSWRAQKELQKSLGCVPPPALPDTPAIDSDSDSSYT